MKATLSNKRRHHRANTGMRVFLKSATGVTRNMSASGVYFWISGTYAIGQSISFWIELKRARGRMMRKCKGKVLRVDRQDSSRVGVAVRITESRMEPT
jgi:PilZ domain